MRNLFIRHHLFDILESYIFKFQIFKNMAHVGSFSHFVFVIVFVFVFVFACAFVIVITVSSSAIIVFYILVSYHFQKYGTCWVF